MSFMTLIIFSTETIILWVALGNVEGFFGPQSYNCCMGRGMGEPR